MQSRLKTVVVVAIGNGIVYTVVVTHRSVNVIH